MKYKFKEGAVTRLKRKKADNTTKLDNDPKVQHARQTVKMIGQAAKFDSKPMAGNASLPARKVASFGKTFASARKAGAKTFDYKGKSYNTRFKGETPVPAAAKSPVAKVPTVSVVSKPQPTVTVQPPAVAPAESKSNLGKALGVTAGVAAGAVAGAMYLKRRSRNALGRHSPTIGGQSAQPKTIKVKPMTSISKTTPPRAAPSKTMPPAAKPTNMDRQAYRHRRTEPSVKPGLGAKKTPTMPAKAKVGRIVTKAARFGKMGGKAFVVGGVMGAVEGAKGLRRQVEVYKQGYYEEGKGKKKKYFNAKGRQIGGFF